MSADTGHELGGQFRLLVGSSLTSLVEFRISPARVTGWCGSDKIKLIGSWTISSHFQPARRS